MGVEAGAGEMAQAAQDQALIRCVFKSAPNLMLASNHTFWVYNSPCNEIFMQSYSRCIATVLRNMMVMQSCLMTSVSDHQAGAHL